MKLPGAEGESDRVFCWQDFTNGTVQPPPVVPGERRALFLGSKDSGDRFRSSPTTIAQGLEELLAAGGAVHLTATFADSFIVIASFTGEV